MSHVDVKESTHIRISHLAHVNESCHTNKWVVSHMRTRRRTYRWGMTHMWRSHVTHMSESCHTCELVAPHVRKSQATHITKYKEMSRTDELAGRQVPTHHVATHCNTLRRTATGSKLRLERTCPLAQMEESWHTREWVMAHWWIGNGAHMNESCHTCESDGRVMTHVWMGHGTLKNR